MSDTLYEVWSAVDDYGTILPLVLIERVNLFQLMANYDQYQNVIITDGNGHILSKDRLTHE